MFFKGQYRNIFVKYGNSDIFGKKYIRQRQRVDFKYLINSLGWLQSYQSIVIF